MPSTRRDSSRASGSRITPSNRAVTPLVSPQHVVWLERIEDGILYFHRDLFPDALVSTPSIPGQFRCRIFCALHMLRLLLAKDQLLFGSSRKKRSDGLADFSTFCRTSRTYLLITALFMPLRPPRIKAITFQPMHLVHLHHLVQAISDFALFGKPIRL